jgi:L-ribulokinase
VTGERYVVGIDFGTESARAILVDCADGSEHAESVHAYGNGVIDRRLPAPDDDVELDADWALQDPRDYVRSVQETVPRLLAETGVPAAAVVGVGVAFTSCTMLPTLADGTPLCLLDELRPEPHAWVKLWKHHAAQPEADRINRVAAERGEPWLRRYGGKISSEWFFAKALQILDEAPELYARAGRLVDAGDWIVWQLTGQERRGACTAGNKAMWSKQDGFPAEEYFAALDPRFARVVDEKMSRTLLAPGTRAGGLCEQAAAWTGLRAGTPVAVAGVDFHVSVPAVTVAEPGTLVMIMGTSNGHLLLGDRLAFVEGMCGVVEDGILPGWFGYEAGQSAVGDILAWFVREAVPAAYRDEAVARGVGVHDVLSEEAAALRPGETGLLALDWWNGNRSVLVDADLRGLIVGMSLATRAPEIYRALIESTAFGTRVIVEAFERAGLPVESIVACGGLPDRNPLLMQIYADVTGREIRVAASRQTPALGAALFAAVAAGGAAGGYDSIGAASERMAHLSDTTYVPDPGSSAIYDRLYAEYLRLHDLFGREPDGVLRALKRIRQAAVAPAAEPAR